MLERKKRRRLDVISAKGSMTENYGINVVGYINSESGLGEGVRTTIRAIESVKIPYALNNITFNLEHRKSDNSFTNFTNENPFSINLFQINADTSLKLFDFLGSGYYQKRYNIGFWAWEMPRFPQEWFYAFNLYDEIWTPSSFCVEAISANSPIPVVRIPHAINPAIPNITKSDAGLSKDKFNFLFIFDYTSTYERKNPVAVVRSFLQAFGTERKDVQLIIKSSNAEFARDRQREVEKLARGAGNISFIDKVLSREKINALIYHCDCYVSLHRAEGFGLTLAEAMFYGKPVIATDYSANRDFMNSGNSFPVKYETIELKEDIGFFRRGDTWAEADVRHASEMMKFVFENQQNAAEIGRKAAFTIQNEFSPLAVGNKIKSRVERINYLREDLTQSQEKLTPSLEKNNRIEIELRTAEAHDLREKIKMMEASRFWKIRNKWFALKRGIGLTRKY